MPSNPRGLNPLVVTAVGAIFGAIAAGCNGEDPAAPGKSNPPPPPPRVTVLSLRLAPDEATFEQGDRFRMTAVQLMSDGSEVAAPAYSPTLPLAQVVQWSTSNNTIVTVSSLTGEAVAVGVGDVEIQGRLSGGAFGSARLTVASVSNSATSGFLTAQGFSVTEFQFAPGTTWFYAPQLRVFAAPGRQVRLLSIQVTIPGFSQARNFPCTAVVTSTSTRLNGDFYGEWTFYSEGAKASGGDATAVLTFVEDTELKSLTIRGPVVSGGFPSTYGDPGKCYTG